MKEPDGFSPTHQRTFHSTAKAGGKRTERAFTRIELLAMCAALGLIALVVAPALAGGKSDAERAVCSNNLRLICRGVQSWAGEHNQQLSWWAFVQDGGTRPFTGTKPGNAWYEYLFLSNELVTPKILACPSDAGVKRAETWYQFAYGLEFRSLALSYPLQLHASADDPRSPLTSDRNFRGSTAGSCPARVSTVNGTTPDLAEWTNGIVHGVYGHVVLMDGSVEFTSSGQLQTVLASSKDPFVFHFLPAR